MDAPAPLPLPLLLSILLIQLPLMVVVPLLLGRWLRRRFDVGWAVFGVGALTFVASQVVHLPLNWAVGLLGPPRAFGLLPLPALAIAAGLSAGLCEELARFVALRFAYRRARGFHAALQFGAGHGGIEAIILGLLVLLTFVNMLVIRYLPATMAKLTPDQSWQVEMAATMFWATPWWMSALGGLERIFAMTSHVLFTVLVMRTITRGRFVWLLLAILAHAGLDAAAVVAARTLGPLATEGLLAVWGIIALLLILRLREPRPAPAALPTALAPTALVLGLLLVLGGCQEPGVGSPTPPPPTPAPRIGPAPTASFAVQSPVVRDGDLLPRDFGCDGRNVSPPLTWDSLPPRTRSLALIVSAPDAPALMTTHWTLWGIPASARELPEGLKADGGMREGATTKGTPGWVGPCPPPGPPHRVEFRLYALDNEPDLPVAAPVLHLHAVMYGHVLAESILQVRYARAPR